MWTIVSERVEKFQTSSVRQYEEIQVPTPILIIMVKQEQELEMKENGL